MRHSRAFSALAATLLATCGARADEIQNRSSVFAGLDKITGRIVKFEAKIGETVQFGTLQITARACYTKPQTEAPQTVGFVQVDEVSADAKTKRIFSGWMFAASPGLNGVEHPVYDVWLLDCQGGYHTLTESAEAETPALAPAQSDSDASSTPSLSPESASLPPDKIAPAARLIAPPPAQAISPSPVQSKPVKAGAAAPALAAPIVVGDAPVDHPAVEPPGPLSPELNGRPHRRPSASSSAAQDDTIPQGRDASDQPSGAADPYAPDAPNPYAPGNPYPPDAGPRDLGSPPPSSDQSPEAGDPDPSGSDRQDPGFRTSSPEDDPPPSGDGGLRPPALIPND